MLLYLSSKPLCLAAIAEALNVSKASVSIACRQLQSLHALKLITREGDRRDFYEAETEMRVLLREGVLKSINRKLESAQEQIRQCGDVLKAHALPGNDTAFIQHRLREAEKARAKVHSLLNNPLLKRFF